MLAVETDSMETVVTLLARGADVNKRTVAGCTALTFPALSLASGAYKVFWRSSIWNPSRYHPPRTNLLSRRGPVIR